MPARKAALAARSKEKAVPAAAPKQDGSNFPEISDKKVIAAAEEYFGLVAEEKKLDLRKKALKPVLIAAMGGAPQAYAGARTLIVTEFATVPGRPDRPITKEMVGGVIRGSNGRKGYSTLSVD